MGNYEAHADVTKNRLCVRAEGFLTDEEIKVKTDNMLKELEKLKPGFDFIGDFSGLKPVSQEGTKEFNRIYQAFATKGIRRHIAVIKDEIARMQLERKSREATHKDEYAASIEEAERMLDNPE